MRKDEIRADEEGPQFFDGWTAQEQEEAQLAKMIARDQEEAWWYGMDKPLGQEVEDGGEIPGALGEFGPGEEF
jgi:L-rhamnose mutarotase